MLRFHYTRYATVSFENEGLSFRVYFTETKEVI